MTRGWGKEENLLNSLFGTDSPTFGTTGSAAVVTGKCKVVVNGQVVERNTNTFELEGHYTGTDRKIQRPNYLDYD